MKVACCVLRRLLLSNGEWLFDTQAGLKAARVHGRMGGRPVQLNTQEIRKLKKHYDKGDLSVMEICKLFNITKPTLYRYLKNEKQKKHVNL